MTISACITSDDPLGLFRPFKLGDQIKILFETTPSGKKELFKVNRLAPSLVNSRIVSYPNDYSEQNNSAHHRKKCNTLGRDAGETKRARLL